MPAACGCAPEAVATDGRLDVCTFDRGSFWHALKYLGFVAIGQHRVLADCSLSRIERVRIESDSRVPYQLDGDPGGVLPLEIEVLPGRLTLAAPYSRLLALGLEPATPQRPAGAQLGAKQSCHDRPLPRRPRPAAAGDRRPLRAGNARAGAVDCRRAAADRRAARNPTGLQSLVRQSQPHQPPARFAGRGWTRGWRFSRRCGGPRGCR